MEWLEGRLVPNFYHPSHSFAAVGYPHLPQVFFMADFHQLFLQLLARITSEWGTPFLFLYSSVLNCKKLYNSGFEYRDVSGFEQNTVNSEHSWNLCVGILENTPLTCPMGYQSNSYEEYGDYSPGPLSRTIREHLES